VQRQDQLWLSREPLYLLDNNQITLGSANIKNNLDGTGCSIGRGGKGLGDAIQRETV